MSLSLLDHTLLDLYVDVMSNPEEKISILEVHNELIDWCNKHSSSNFSSKSGSIYLLNERIDLLTDLLFLIGLALG